MRWSLLLLCVVLGGCAGLTAHKVPLQHRLAGADKQKGFRYYLSRPYIVVSQRILVHQEILPGVLIEDTANKKAQVNVTTKYGVRVLMPDGKATHLDLSGNPLPKEAAKWTPVHIDDPTVPNTSAEMAVSFSAFPEPVNYMDPYRSLNSVAAAAYSDVQKQTPIEDVSDMPPPFQVVHLPDFEEQMAVKHHAFLSTNKFSMLFRDGWQLDSLQNNSDTTDVPVAILKTLQKAISAAAGFESDRLRRVAEIHGQGPAPQDTGEGKEFIPRRMAVVQRYYIEPGMYRLNKESERNPDTDESSPCGLLTAFGLPLAGDTEVLLIAPPPKTELGAGAGPTCAAPAPTCAAPANPMQNPMQNPTPPAPAPGITPVPMRQSQATPRLMPSQPDFGQLSAPELAPPQVLRVDD